MILIVGYGKMGRLVEQLAPSRACEIAGRVDVAAPSWAPADVAIDFSTADALPGEFRRAMSSCGCRSSSARPAGRRTPALRAKAEQARLGVVASANFSIGVNLFELMAAEAARLMRAQPQYGAWIHEPHHATKRDAPSGTALLLRDAMAAGRIRRADRHVVHARRV